jgi:hypothetical protein
MPQLDVIGTAVLVGLGAWLYYCGAGEGVIGSVLAASAMGWVHIRERNNLQRRIDRL